ncbi:hypothetical protein O0L34_g3090 [Tuta absoluta]|nr:hypothetical protein O0L34_g3090 [Tuta absoluta]
MQFNKVTHVLFDLDGLLIDSEKFYTQAYVTVCAKYGKKFTWELNATLLGFQGQECADKIISALQLPLTREQFMDECHREHLILFPELQLMPGATRLVEHLHKNGVPIAIATSSPLPSIDMKMQNHKEFLNNFHHITTGSDPEVTKGKPDPVIFMVCASRFPDAPSPENCLVFEDAVNGVRAARAANMQVVVVPDPRVPSDHLTDATLVLKSLEDFQPQLFGLPAY